MPSADFFPLLIAVPLLPLGAWLAQVFLGARLPRGGDWLPTGALAAALGIAVLLYLRALGLGEDAGHFVWSTASTGGGHGWKWLVSDPELTDGLAAFRAGLWYDGLTAPLLVMVSLVSLLVHLFSTGYMKGDSRYPAYFAGLALFSFAMLAMLVSDNLLFVFVFWELMGLCSFRLIGHDALDRRAPRPQAAHAAVKALLTTRVGDVALLLGLGMLWNGFGTLQFHELAREVPLAIELAGGWPDWLETAGLLVVVGAVGKSAQFPLHVWLPDAMEGPTPVSAMIHAATMVAAGVYLLARAFLALAPAVLAFVVVLGAFTALFAATVALAQHELKRVLAWSTISQLGFMTAAVGLGSPDGALFHVFTHGLFKAGLFLGAGAVIHACHHRQDLRELGGLRRRMPWTHASMLLCTAALAGVPFLSGFVSKDAILAFGVEAWNRGGGVVAYLPLTLLAVAAALTPLYMFRAHFLVFGGEARTEDARAAEEVPLPMRLPLVVLGLGAVLGAWPWLAAPHPSEAAHTAALVLSLLALVLGLGAAVTWFGLRKADPSGLVRALQPWPRAAHEGYGVDAFYRRLLIRPVRLFAQGCAWCDRALIDGLVHGIGRAAVAAGEGARRLQTGHLQRYLVLTYLGLLLVLLFGLGGLRG